MLAVATLTPNPLSRPSPSLTVHIVNICVATSLVPPASQVNQWQLGVKSNISTNYIIWLPCEKKFVGCGFEIFAMYNFI